MKKFLLSLCVTMLSFVGVWAQAIEDVSTADVEGAPIRRLEVTLSGDWLGGTDVEAKTTELIDLIMGYEEDGFNANKAFTEVTIKSSDEGVVTLNKSLVRQLVAGKYVDASGQYMTSKNLITRLDLSEVAVTEYVGHETNDIRNSEATFMGNNTNGASSIKFFAMPSFDEEVDGQTYTVPTYVLSGLDNLEEIELPSNAQKLASAAFADGSFEKFKLNQGLKFIGNSAFYVNNKREGMETLEVPSSVEYIGPHAFYNRIYTDIYFHSAQAPLCPAGIGYIDHNDGAMLIEDCYMGNGGQSMLRQKADKYSEGYANRENYYSDGYRWFVMIHFPSSAEMSALGQTLDIPSYKDDTRVYNKVYGSYYYTNDNDKGRNEIGVVGMEQNYLERQKVWDGRGADYVGKESDILSFSKYSTLLAPTDNENIPVEARGKGVVQSGYEDTYRGLNYIWPSQSQCNRAYITVANGLKWDGVTPYRPTLTDKQIAYMIEDRLTLTVDGNDVVVGTEVTYDEAMANAYNAGLEGAVHAGEAKAWYTADEAIEFNAELSDAVDEGDSKGEYTAEEAIAHNESLPTAIHEGDAKEIWTAEDAAANNEELEGAWHVNDPIYPTAQEVLDHNADFDGAKHEGDVLEEGHDAVYMTFEQFKENGGYSYGWAYNEDGYTEIIEKLKAGTTQWDWNMNVNPLISPAVETTYYTAEQAAAYNAENHPAPWTIETVIGNVTAEQAIAHNETLDGAVKEGDTKVAYTAEEALAWNSDPENNPGRVVAGDSKGTYSADEAIAYNESLPNAKHEGDEKDWWTEEDAIAENKKLDGHREAGYSENNTVNADFKDLLSKLAFQSTRRCVFAANDGGGDHYDPKIPTSKAWWTICLPFDLTKAQIDKYFGEGTHLCEFNKVERKITDLQPGEKPYVKFYFTKDVYVGKGADDVVLKAHTAYMIFPMLSDADAAILSEGIPMDEYYIKTGNPLPTEVVSNDEEKYRFIGNYDTKLPVTLEDGTVTTTDVVVPQYSYIYAKKNGATGKHPYQFWFTQNANIKWGANKCIIQSTSRDRGLTDNNTFFTEDVQGAKGQTQQITLLGDDLDDAEATAIDVIIIAGNGEDSEVIYNLNGQKLNAVPQNGVYIKNGKKYIVR